MPIKHTLATWLVARPYFECVCPKDGISTIFEHFFDNSYKHNYMVNIP